MKLILLIAGLFALAWGQEGPVDYSGHKVITAIPSSRSELLFLRRLRQNYGVYIDGLQAKGGKPYSINIGVTSFGLETVDMKQYIRVIKLHQNVQADLWNEPRAINSSIMIRLPNGTYETVTEKLTNRKIKFFLAIEDLQSLILSERVLNSPSERQQAGSFDFGRYNEYDQIINFLSSITSSHPSIAKLVEIGKSYENRPIYAVKISSGDGSGKQAVMIECGIHAREWSSVAAGVYIVNELITKYGSDSSITSLVNTYEFNIIVEANPDGYIFTWTGDRLWRKTRSRSSIDWMGNCRGADANRNFDIDHCGVGTSRKPCDDIYCGDAPFSESETRAVRDLMTSIGSSRMKVYFTLHAYSQFWMTPYGTSKSLPPNYSKLIEVGVTGAQALANRYGTKYRVGSIANIIYVATGSSVDYAYTVLGIKMAYALELRDTGRYGFFLPAAQILPTCEETLDGLTAAILAI